MSVKCRVIKGGWCEITQGYGVNGHIGIDIVNKGYTLGAITAHTDGVVVMTQTGHKNNQGSTGNASYGNMVKIEHSSGCYTLYAHLDSVYVTNGQRVAKGQEIGYMGNTGNSYGGHLHFEVWKNNTRIDPTPYLDQDLQPQVTVPKPVNRNEKVDQVEVVYPDTLRVRKDHSTQAEVIGMALKGYYNIVSTYKASDYMWYELEKGKWVANVGEPFRLLPKKEEPKPVEPTPIEPSEKEQIDALLKEMEELNKELLEKEQEIEILEKTIEEMQVEPIELNKFVAPKTDNYFIKLNENQTLEYRKV